LNLISERFHVGREAVGHQDADIKCLDARMLLSLVEPTFKIPQHLRALRNRLVIHRAIPFVLARLSVLRVLERDRPDLHGDEAGALGVAKRSPCRYVLGEIGIPVITDGRP
jgi:hypothetical protein